MSQALMIHSEEALAQAVSALVALDPVRLAPLVNITGLPPLRRRPPGFDGLVAIIISQQVSVASATAIMARVKAMFEPLVPQDILSAGDEPLRACGLSAPKIRTLTALSHALMTGTLDLGHLAHLPATQAHQALVAVKGIGPWTADVFLLFCLGHPDIWPVGDLALQEAMRMLFGLAERPDPREMTRLAEGWQPYRAVAARLLWAYYTVMKARAGVV